MSVRSITNSEELYSPDLGLTKVNSMTIGPERLADVVPEEDLDRRTAGILCLGKEAMIKILFDKEDGWLLEGWTVDYKAKLTRDSSLFLGREASGGDVFPSTVSRYHCALLPRPDGTLNITDMRSHNGTYLVYHGETYPDAQETEVSWRSAVAERDSRVDTHIVNDKLGTYGVFGGARRRDIASAKTKRFGINAQLPHGLGEVFRHAQPEDASSWIARSLGKTSAAMSYDKTPGGVSLVARMVECGNRRNLVWHSMGRGGLYLLNNQDMTPINEPRSGEQSGIVPVESGDRFIMGLPQRLSERRRGKLHDAIMSADTPEEVVGNLSIQHRSDDPVVTVFVN